MTLSRCISRLCLAMLAAACGESVVGEAGPGPHVTGMEHASLVVGQTQRFYGRNFLTPEEGVTKLEIEGGFTPSQGEQRWTSLTVTPVYDGTTDDALTDSDPGLATHTLRWSRFGPFEMPFLDENSPGRFEGQIRAVNHYNDGRVEADPYPYYAELEVLPSLVVRKLSPVLDEDDKGPVVASCAQPALRAFGGIPYVLEVEAMGFTPVEIDYGVQGVDGQWSYFHHEVVGARDRLGDWGQRAGERLLFGELDRHLQFAYVTITMTAVDTEGQSHYSALPLAIVRPLQVQSDGHRQLAEYYEPVAVYGPIVGGIATSISYSEGASESRQRGVSVHISENFAQSNDVSRGSNWSEGISIGTTTSTSTEEGVSQSTSETTTESHDTTQSNASASNVSYSTQDGTNWDWTMGVNFGGQLNIPFLNGFTSGLERRQTHSENREFGTSTTETVSASVSGSYAVSAQSTLSRSTARAEASERSVTYNMGQSESTSESYSVGQSEAWNDTWSSTQDSNTLLSYSSKLPRGRCGVVYRQTVRFVRTAKVFGHGACGERETMAELTFNEWSWSPNIAVGDGCEQELPRSTQPLARCFLACE